jgi:GT2 family glycosyltransferase
MLASLVSQVVGKNVEIVVADNGSTDRSADLVRTFGAQHSCIRLVDASLSRGGAYARNVGAANAAGSILLFLDDDDVVEPGWLDSMLAASTDECLLAGPVDEWSLARYPTWRASTSRFHPPLTLRGQMFAMSANCAISRQLFERVGGFRTDLLGVGGDDVDLSWHVESLGCPITFVPGAVVLKRPKASRRAMFSQWSRYSRSTGTLHHRHPDRARPMRSQWSPPPSDLVREVWRCLRHPVLNQGVYIQVIGLVTGRLAATFTRPRTDRLTRRDPLR